MPADALTMSITGPDGQQFSASIAKNLGDLPTKWMPRVWWYVVEYFGRVLQKRNFETEGAYLGEGTQWYGIEDVYRQAKVRRYGSGADFIGRASGQMMKVYTNFHGPGGIFEVSGDGMSVTFGGEVFAGAGGSARSGGSILGDEYSQYYNDLRKLFGTGDKLPPDAEFELGKLIGAIYLQLMRIRTGTRSRSGVEWRPDGELAVVALDGFRPGDIDALIRSMETELGFGRSAGRAA